MTNTESNVTSRDQSSTIWTEEDYETLVGGIRARLDLSDIVNLLGRTPGAIRSRAPYLLASDEEREPGEKALDILRRLVCENADYDWETHARRVSAEKGWHYWSRDELADLVEHWETRSRLTALAARYALSETQMVDFLIRRRIATSTIEVVERLGCTPGGHIETRYNLSLDRAQAEVWALVMTRLPRKASTHVSLHGTRGAAELQREEVLNALSATTSEANETEIWWCISRRVPGFPYGPVHEGRHIVAA